MTIRTTLPNGTRQHCAVVPVNLRPRTRGRSAAAAGFATFLAMTASGTALAAPGAAASASAAASTLQTVIVTAERVRTNVQRTPVSMEVYSQAQLVNKGVVSFRGLTQADSSLNFISGDGAEGNVSMRGISGVEGSGFGTTIAVPISFDGFYYGTDMFYGTALYDIDRSEVLRGPQGTLFGRNTTGGLVRIITNNPTRHFGGYASLTFGDYNTVDVQGALNLPISDKLQMRLAFSSARHSGYHTTATGQPVDDRDTNSGRLKVAYEPTGQLKLLFSFQETHLGGAGGTDNIVLLPANASNFPTHAAFDLSKLDQRQYNISFPSTQDITDKLTQWRAVYRGMPWGMTLTYLGGYDQFSYAHGNPVVGLDAVSFGVPTTIDFASSMNPATQNQEIRLASARHRRVTWQGGIYYFRQDIAHNDTRFFDEGQPTQPDIVDFFYNNEDRSLAGYGQAQVHMGPTIFSAGLRYTRDYLEQTDLLSPGDGIFPARQSISDAEWTYHVGDQWNITDRNMVYAKLDTGYSPGAFALNVPCNCTGGPPLPSTIEPYKAEYVTTYEIGSKNRFFDNHVQLNMDGFYSGYRDQQLQTSNAGGTVTVNAKTSNIYGAEAEFAALGRVGRFNLEATWLHARFDQQYFTNALGQSFDIGGYQLVRAPAFSLTADLSHTFAIGSGTLTPEIGTKFQTGQYFDFYNVADSYQPAYHRSYVNLTYAPNAGRWSVNLYVRNLENSVVIADESEAFTPPITQPGTYNIDFQSPRTFGVTITDRF